MNKAILLTFALLALFSLASASSLRTESLNSLWGAWKTAHNKQYSTSEETHRFSIFTHNIQKIAKLNTQSSDVKYAINKFADLTASEFKAKYTNSAISHPKIHSEELLEFPITSSLPSSVDWRN